MGGSTVLTLLNTSCGTLDEYWKMSHLHTCIGFLKMMCYPSEYVVPWHLINITYDG